MGWGIWVRHKGLGPTATQAFVEAIQRINSHAIYPSSFSRLQPTFLEPSAGTPTSAECTYGLVSILGLFEALRDDICLQDQQTFALRAPT